MEVKNVESSGVGEHLLHEPDVMGQGLAATGILPEGTRAGGNEARAGDGIPARKERHVVPEPHELFREVRHHALGSSVAGRGDAFAERSDLGDVHGVRSLRQWRWFATRISGKPCRAFSKKAISTRVGQSSIEPLRTVSTSSTIRRRFWWKKSGSRP